MHTLVDDARMIGLLHECSQNGNTLLFKCKKSVIALHTDAELAKANEKGERAEEHQKSVISAATTGGCMQDQVLSHELL